MLRDHFEKSGDWLFRWRSYMPLAFLPFLALAVSQGEPLEAQLGEPWGDVWENFAIALVILGQMIRIATVGRVPEGTSGRNTFGQLASTLNTTGLYSVCRNPLYLGNCTMYLGVGLYTQNLAVALVMALALALYYERIISAEESFLAKQFGQTYRDWTARTPAFWPRLRQWQPSELTFSWRTVVRREQASVLGAVVALSLITFGQDFVEPNEPAWPQEWLWALGITALAFAIAQFLKKTGRLKVEGR